MESFVMPSRALFDLAERTLQQHRYFIGTIVPSSNTVVERITLAMLRDFPDVSPHFARSPVVGSRDPFPNSYDFENMLMAARMLGHARLNAICWNGSKGATIGLHEDRELCQLILENTGIRATTSMLALDEVLRSRNLQRIALVTPYADNYQKKTINALKYEGYDCVAEAHCGLSDNFSYAQVPLHDIAQMVVAVARAEPQAIVTLCTNFPAATVIPALEAKLGIPIFDTVSIGVWGALRLAGVDRAKGKDWGQVFLE
jgi:maleate isomerase